MHPTPSHPRSVEPSSDRSMNSCGFQWKQSAFTGFINISWDGYEAAAQPSLGY